MFGSAATVMLSDYASLPVERRNILRSFFLDPKVRGIQDEWEKVARFIVGAFRIDATRSGAISEVGPLVAEICEGSADFKRMWEDNDVQAPHGDGVKQMRHPVLGPLAFEYSAFVVDGRDRVACATNSVDALTPSGVMIWDNTERKRRYRAGQEALLQQGFRRIDFEGLVPILPSGSVTTVFYRPGNCLGI